MTDSFTLCLLRHGQTDSNVNKLIQGHTDVPLNQVGRAQAQEAAERLKDTQFDRIVSSPLKRASETAETVAEFQAVGVEYDSRLKERAFGTFEGQSQLAMAELGYTPETFWDDSRPIDETTGLETLEHFDERISESLEDIVSAADGFPRVLLVAHGGVIRRLLRGLGIRPDASAAVGNASEIVIRRTSAGEWEGPISFPEL